MSFAEDTRQLRDSLMRTRDGLTGLLEQLQQRRAAWVSIRPDVLAPGKEIELLSQQLAREENLRAGLLRRIGARLPRPPGTDPERRHLNITRIAAALPHDQAQALRAVGDEVTDLSRRVRNETTLGQRLLRFAQRAHGTLDREPAAAGRKVPGYDRRAQNVQRGGTAGQFVDGRM